MSKVPPSLREPIQARLWTECDELGWLDLPYAERAPYYERWTKDPRVGGQLAHLMDPREVRVYIKDTLVKPYVRERLLNSEQAVRTALGLSHDDAVAQRFIKPHGQRLADGRVLCWGRSREWKSVLLAVFERSAEPTSSALGAILVESGQTEVPARRQLVRLAADRLGIPIIKWLGDE